MNLLSADNLSRNIGERWLFQGLTFGLSRGDKVALVGRNGTGKTSLLDVLAGLHPPDAGQVALARGLRLGYLPQQPEFEPSLTVMDVLFSEETPMAQAVRAYEQALLADDPDALAAALEGMETHKAWDYEARMKQVLGRLGVQEAAFGQAVGSLSGGQRKRVALARLLLQEPDLLLLDEPTNHLDLAAIEWLEGYLSTAGTTLLLVTHDRYFLDRVCNQVLELDGGSLYRYRGNYAHFLEKQAERLQADAAETDRARNLMRKELDWMRRQPKARGTKAKYRVDAFYELQERAGQVRTDESVALQTGMSRLGKKILEVEHLQKAFGSQPIVRDFSYVFRRQERVGLVGQNGVGKTTFLNLLTGLESPDAGQLSVGETIRFGYYRQQEPDFAETDRVIDVVSRVAEVITLGNGQTITAGQFLQQFLFDPKKQYTHVGKLSGGERRRLQLLLVLVQQPNFLILDEPTNDLDIQTLNVLEEYLMGFQGCLLLVSHDRYFMDQLVDHLFVMEGQGHIRDFPGNYTDYREATEAAGPAEMPAVAAAAATPPPVVPAAEPPARRRLSFKEQRELEQLEADMATLEARRADLTARLNAAQADYQQLTQWATDIEALTADIEVKEMRWLELEG